MPRVNRVQRARKPTKCGKCGQQISKGDPYRWWKFHSSGKRVRCMKPECSPRRSELTQSAIYAAAWDAQDAASDALANAQTKDDLEALRDDLASDIDSIVDELQEKLDNIESGMGHTDVPIYEELDERRQNYEEWKDAVENVDVDDANCDVCNGDGTVECDKCSGSGFAPCEPCVGTGSLTKECECNDAVENIVDGECERCDGNGEYEVECDACGGNGLTDTQCDKCGGDGTVQCDECEGAGASLDDVREALQSAIDECPE